LSLRGGLCLFEETVDLRNEGTVEIQEYAANALSLNRYPDDSEAAQRLYEGRPLTKEWIRLRATDSHGELDVVQIANGIGSLQFAVRFEESSRGRTVFLGAGMEGRHVCCYELAENICCSSIDKKIRIPTDVLEFSLDLPTNEKPVVYGFQWSSFGPKHPITPRPIVELKADRTVANWRTRPRADTEYAISWRWGTR
jgi:hypothetical protein